MEGVGEVPGLQGYVAERLVALGLETNEDLALVELEDLRPDLVALSGVASFELEALGEEFPRSWTYQGSSYACTVRIRARRVTLEPVTAQAKRAKEPSPKVLPRFRGFGVVYKQASRKIVLR